MGLQAWQDRLMKELGRIHGREEFLDNLYAARTAGFENINADLIFGLPGQTVKDWTETVENVAGLGIPHISCYDLIIEEGTVFGDRFEKGLLEPMEDELDREMYHNAVTRLASHGYRQYELSNFALPGHECKHNLIYWRAEEYLGLGAGAHSYLFGQRFNNVPGIEGYIERTPESTYENLTAIDQVESMSEFMILGLRLVEGVSLSEFRERYGEELQSLYGRQISELTGRGLLKKEGGRIKLTELGLDLANKVFVEFI
jgi:oxygen-independent coproporphyrinogen-3 oxidase